MQVAFKHQGWTGAEISGTSRRPGTPWDALCLCLLVWASITITVASTHKHIPRHTQAHTRTDTCRSVRYGRLIPPLFHDPCVSGSIGTGAGPQGCQDCGCGPRTVQLIRLVSRLRRRGAKYRQNSNWCTQVFRWIVISSDRHYITNPSAFAGESNQTLIITKTHEGQAKLLCIATAAASPGMGSGSPTEKHKSLKRWHTNVVTGKSGEEEKCNSQPFLSIWL